MSRRYPHIKPMRRAEIDSQVIERWVDLRERPPEGWDDGSKDDPNNLPDPRSIWRDAALEIAIGEVESQVDSIYKGEAVIVLRAACPCCGVQIELEITGGEITAREDMV